MPEFTAPSAEELQEKFPNHTIEGFIAQGGMGAVYLANQTSLERPVAIKILPKEFGEDVDYRVSFETEAKAMARLNHNNLIQIYDFGDIDGMLYIIMEYMPGRTLFKVAHGQQVDQIEAASLIRDMCNGLDHAHASGILHRDIKPANVLIDDEGRPKIVDFGLARPLGEEQNGGVIFGTLGYTAPEVLTNPLAVDQRSDIFSMGVMLYEMLTGIMPADPVVPASHVAILHRGFDAIVNRAIHPDPDRRFSTAGEMSEALGELIKKLQQMGGVIATGNITQNSPLLIGASSTGRISSLGRKPVALSSQSSGGAGITVGIIASLVIIGIIIVSVNGDNELKARTTNVAKIAQGQDLENLGKAEKGMAVVAEKKRLAHEKAAELQREQE